MGCGVSKEEDDRKVEAIPASAKKEAAATAKETKKIVEKKVEEVAAEAGALVDEAKKATETVAPKKDKEDDEEKKSEEKGSPKVLVLYYSMYGHIAKMAESVAEGAEGAGASVKIMRIPETLSEEVLKKMGAPPKHPHPEVTTTEIADADCILIGIPTRFGMAAAQVKAIMDRTGKLWMTGGLVGKVGGIFFSTGTQGGGQETTAMTFITQFVHHVIIKIDSQSRETTYT